MEHLQNTAQELLEHLENAGITKWAYREPLKMHLDGDVAFPSGAIVFAIRLDYGASSKERALFEFFEKVSRDDVGEEVAIAPNPLREAA